MTQILAILLGICLAALLAVAGYAAWRMRRRLAAARRPPPSDSK